MCSNQNAPKAIRAEETAFCQEMNEDDDDVFFYNCFITILT